MFRIYAITFKVWAKSLVLMLLVGGCQMNFAHSQNQALIQKLKSTNNLISLWTFKEPPGKPRKAIGKGKFPLKEANGEIERENEGPLSGYAIKLSGDNFLTLDHSKIGQLNIHGNGKQVTVIAWVKWTGEGVNFVGGIWNEYQNGGRRQYGLFVNLPAYNGENQVCGHISKTGKPTPPFPYSIDYSASSEVVPVNEWSCIAMTYDGNYIKSYLNGIFTERAPELIKNTKGFEGYPEGLVQSKNPYYFPYGMGNNGSDFTVGAVLIKSGMGNFFKGLIGGLAVFDRALNEQEIQSLVK